MRLLGGSLYRLPDETDGREKNKTAFADVYGGFAFYYFTHAG